MLQKGQWNVQYFLLPFFRVVHRFYSFLLGYYTFFSTTTRKLVVIFDYYSFSSSKISIKRILSKNYPFFDELSFLGGLSPERTIQNLPLASIKPASLISTIIFFSNTWFCYLVLRPGRVPSRYSRMASRLAPSALAFWSLSNTMRRVTLIHRYSAKLWRTSLKFYW